MKLLSILFLLITSSLFSFECRFVHGTPDRISTTKNAGVIEGTPNHYLLYNNEGEKQDKIWWNYNHTLADCVYDAVTCEETVVRKKKTNQYIVPGYKEEFDYWETQVVDAGRYEYKIINRYDTGANEDQVLAEFNNNDDGVTSCKQAKKKYAREYSNNK